MSSVISSPLIKTYTLEEFWQLPDPPDHSKLELIAGVLYMTPPPDYTHDYSVTRLNRILSGHMIATNDHGKLLVPRAAIWTSPNTHLEPDLFYVSAETEASLDPNRRTTADLVVEVISPGSSIYDRNTKAETYAALGVRELWLIDERTRTVEVRKLVGNEYLDRETFGEGECFSGSIFPTLSIRVSDLFED
jgi:Uma2 family endonuclease